MPPRSDSSNDPRFSDADVSRILQRVVELQQQALVPTGGLTLHQLEDVAREAGLDARLVAQAAADVTAAPETGDEEVALLSGAPVRTRVVRHVAARLVPAATAAIEAELRQVFGAGGELRVDGDTLSWTTSEDDDRTVRVSIVARREGSLVTVEERHANLYISAIGIPTFCAVVLSGFAGLLTALESSAGWPLGVAIPTITTLATVLLGRAAAQREVRRRARELATLADTITEVVAVPVAP